VALGVELGGVRLDNLCVLQAAERADEGDTKVLLSVQASYGAFSSRLLVGVRLRRKTTMAIDSFISARASSFALAVLEPW
jgi:hypothetical protein